MVAEEFVKEALADGSMSSVELEAGARARGISHATLKRAKKALNVNYSVAEFQGGWQVEIPRVAQFDSGTLNWPSMAV
jgi:hypothetical protein